jgi:ketosteroid isomerase-like protein
MKNIILMFVLMFAFAGIAFGECSESDKKALEAFDHAWGIANETGDRAAMMAIYADDYTGFPGLMNKTTTIENVMKTFEQAKANPQAAAKVTPDHYAISCTSNTATIVHRNVISTNGTNGKEETVWARSVHFLEKRNGKWQAVSNAGTPMNDAMTLSYMELDWNNADMKRDTNWFERNFAADYSSVSSSDGKLSNKAEDIADNKTGKRVLESIELSDVNVRIEGNTAVVTGVNRVKGRDDKNQPMDYRFRFTDTFIKRDGRWQAWATQGTRMQ